MFWFWIIVGIALIVGSYFIMKTRRRGWFILTSLGLLVITLTLASGLVGTVATIVALVAFIFSLIIGVGHLFFGSIQSFWRLMQGASAVLAITALVAFGTFLGGMAPSTPAQQAQAQGDSSIPAGAGAQATVTNASATEQCRSDAVNTYLQGQGFATTAYTVGAGKINHSYAELTATGSARFGAASTTRKGLKQYLNSDSGPAKANRAMLKAKYPNVPTSTLLDVNNWEVFQSKVPMNISGNTGWENGKPVSLGTRNSTSGDAAWLYVDPVTCKVPAASSEYETTAMVTSLSGSQAQKASTRAVGVIRVGCSNPGNNVTPQHPTSTPTPKPTTSKTTPVCKYNSHLPANSSKCKPTPSSTPTPSCGCVTSTPTPTQTPSGTPTPTSTSTPSPTCSVQCGSTPPPTSTPTPTPTPSATCTYGTDSNGNCSKGGDWPYPSTKPSLPLYTTNPDPTPSIVVTQQTGGGGVSDSATNAPGSETGGNAPGATPAPTTPRPVPTDEGGGRSSSTTNPEPVHTAPVTQPIW